jgi:hypothetical protein
MPTAMTGEGVQIQLVSNVAAAVKMEGELSLWQRVNRKLSVAKILNVSNMDSNINKNANISHSPKAIKKARG